MLTRKYPALTPVQSLAVIYSPSEDYAIAAGETFELRITVSNQGNHSAIIKVYLDDTSQPLWQWCRLSTQYLALETQQSSEIVLQIPIPLDTPPGVYSYLVVVDASQHYPDENPIQHQAKLTVLPPVQSVVKVNDPTFNIIPPSTSVAPLILQPIKMLELEVVVFNRSNRVDRFRLSAIDLPRSWWSVIYPEGIEDLGLVAQTDSLALNPQESTTIKLRIHPALTAKAGQYSSTIQLKSVNFPKLVLLDIVYFQLAPIHSFNWELKTIVGKVRREQGKFAIALHNQGNTVREVKLTAKEEQEDRLCEYTLAQEQIKLLPKTHQTIELQVRPKKLWRRPWVGRGFPLKFQLECQDVYQLPLSRQQVTGTLVWEARPWWHLLLVILTITGSVTGLILAIWWLLFKPPTAPKIRDFAAESSLYQADNGDFVNLNWQIEHPQSIDTLEVVGRSPEGKVISQPLSFDFSQGIPEELADLCIQERILHCRNIRTDAKQAGDYIFELTLSSREPKHADSKLATNTITIQPFPTPQINQVQATVASNSNKNTVYLDFTVTNADRLQRIKLTGFDPNGVINYPTQHYDLEDSAIAELESYCQSQNQALNCTQVPLSVDKPGQYIFELAAIKATNTGEMMLVDSQKSMPVAIAAPASPQIANLTSTQPIYQEQANSPIMLNWDIIQPEQLAAIKLVSRSPEGIVNTPLITYDFSQGIPPELDQYCYLTDIISCRHIPTQAQQAGDYLFELMSVTKANAKLVDSTITSDLIRIESIPLPPPPPAPLEILSFKINGVDAPPKYIAQINPKDPNTEITISWDILSDPSATIELLPAPGKVKPKGILSYPLSNQPTTETLTIRITDPSGRKLERSLIIETVVAKKVDDDKSQLEKNIPQGDRQDSILTPIDLPPKFMGDGNDS